MRPKHRKDYNHGKQGFVGGNPRHQRTKAMAKRKEKLSDSNYTAEDRKRFLYRTAAEMRIINDKADSRHRNDAQREEQAADCRVTAPDDCPVNQSPKPSKAV